MARRCLGDRNSLRHMHGPSQPQQPPPLGFLHGDIHLERHRRRFCSSTASATVVSALSRRPHHATTLRSGHATAGGMPIRRAGLECINYDRMSAHVRRISRLTTTLHVNPPACVCAGQPFLMRYYSRRGVRHFFFFLSFIHTQIQTHIIRVVRSSESFSR